VNIVSTVICDDTPGEKDKDIISASDSMDNDFVPAEDEVPSLCNHVGSHGRLGVPTVCQVDI